MAESGGTPPAYPVPKGGGLSSNGKSTKNRTACGEAARLCMLTVGRRLELVDRSDLSGLQALGALLDDELDLLVLAQ